MVFHFHPRGFKEGSEDWLIFMGRDKHENEDLIRYGLPIDVWFHVDNLSSAHVYLRLPDGTSMEDIPADTLEDCIQLVKQNSIQGCKLNNVDIVYTPWANLKKTKIMEVGQVGFHDQKKVLKATVDRKTNEIINRLEKTRLELTPDFKAEQEAYLSRVRAAKRQEEKTKREEEKAAKEENRRQKELKGYTHIMTDENMVSNKEYASKYNSVEEMEDDFM